MLEIIEMIAQAKSNRKIAIMKEHPELMQVFQYAYDPHKKFYITAPDVVGEYNGADDIPYSFLDDLSSGVVSGNIAKDTIHDYIINMDPDLSELFKRIINKDLRCGVSLRTINKVWPGLIKGVYDGSEKPKIMLVNNPDKKRFKFPCLAAVKKDGVRGEFYDKLISRQCKELIGHEHLEVELSKYGQDFAGEIMVPGCIFDVASGLIRDKNPTPDSVYWIFDVPSVDGTKLERLRWLHNNIVDTEHVKLIPHRTIHSYEQLKEFEEEAVAMGDEGIVYYDKDSLYNDGKTYEWMRLVPIKSADCEVIGFEEGKGKLSGSLGKIIVDYKGHEVKVGSGFKEKFWVDLTLTQQKRLRKEGWTQEAYGDCVRDHIWNNQDYFLGKIAKVEYKEKTKAGSLRQPRFKRWRFDK